MVPKRPEIGDTVWITFPRRGWLCPAIVVSRPKPKDSTFAIDVIVFNKNVPFNKTQQRNSVPYERAVLSDKFDAVWQWPPNRMPND